MNELTWRVVALAMGIASLVGCGGEGPLETSESAIYEGTRDDGSDSAVVALRVGDTSPYRLCTGALIAPNVVLTARHCTSLSAVETVGCSAVGQSTNGDHFAGDIPASSIRVFTGATPVMSGTPTAVGERVFRPSSRALCNTDIALVVLNKNISNVKPLSVRFGAGVEAGERVRSVGYGENDHSYTAGIRYVKTDVEVLAVGAGVQKNGTVLGSAEFEVGRATCQGDSGGPALSMKTGAIVGVASRGVSCSLDFGHIYGQPAAFTELFDEAFLFAGGGPIEEVRDRHAAPEPAYRVAEGCTASGADPRGGIGMVLLLFFLGFRRRRSP